MQIIVATPLSLLSAHMWYAGCDKIPKAGDMWNSECRNPKSWETLLIHHEYKLILCFFILLTISKIGNNEKRNSVGNAGTFENVVGIKRDNCRLLADCFAKFL